ncbi:hypothetical protein GGD38_006412 [Chitinophagaceae bacterium OAS944]|nr:hypothetical protein [Chitinophagaceae bacterium OAS944]
MKQERILGLILKRQFDSLSIKQENLLGGLIEKEIVNKKIYTQLLNDRNKLIDYIINQSEKCNGPFDISIQNAFKKFQNKLKTKNKI